MIKRLFVCFLAALMCVCVVPVSAETKGYDYVNLDKTTVEEDLSMLDLSQYKVNQNIKNVSIITFAEQGIDGVMDFADFKLYVYIYNPSGKALSVVGNNQIQLGRTEDTISKYALMYVDSNDAKTIYKYRVGVDNTFYDSVLNLRGYYVSGIELQGINGLMDYPIGGAWIYEGYGEDATLEKVVSFETISLDVHFSTYRVAGDLDYMHQLTSVYFIVPNYYEERYGEVYGMDCTYERYYTKPYVVTNNKTLLVQLRDASTKILTLKDMKYSNLGKDYFSSDISNGLISVTEIPVMDQGTIYQYNWWYNVDFSSWWNYGGTNIFKRNYGASLLPVVIWADQDFDEDLWVDGEEVTNSMYDFYESALGKNSIYKNSDIGYYYHSLLFEPYWLDQSGAEHYFQYRASGNTVKYHSAKQFESITFDSDEYDIYSYSSTHDWFDKFIDIGISALWTELKNDITYEGLSRVERVSKHVSGANDKTVSTEYLIDINEVDEFQSEVTKANNSDGTVFLFRLDVAPYYSGILETTSAINFTKKGHAMYFQEPVYMGFDVINLKFVDNDGEVVNVAVTSDPKDLVGGVEAPPSESTESKLPELNINLPDLSGIGEDINKGISDIIMIFALLVVIMLFVVYLVPKIAAFSKAVSSKENKRKKKEKKK